MYAGSVSDRLSQPQHRILDLAIYFDGVVELFDLYLRLRSRRLNY